jgi:hypothetical protein
MLVESGHAVVESDCTFVGAFSHVHASTRRERVFLFYNLLVRINFIVEMIRWTGFAPWECEFLFPGRLSSTFLDLCSQLSQIALGERCRLGECCFSHCVTLCVQRFRSGLVFKAHRSVYHSTPGLRVIKKKTKRADSAC